MPDPVVLAAPIPCRVGITRWEPGPLTDALAARLRRANLFAEVYYPLESGAEMDASIEFDVHRAYASAPTVGETALDVITLGMVSGSHPTRYRAILRGDLSLRVGERTLRKLEKTVRISCSVKYGSPIAAVRELADQGACEQLAARLVEELARDPAKLAAEIAAGPGASVP